MVKPTKNNSNWVANLFMQGMEFGYPPCCIGEFIVRSITNTHGERPPRKFNGTGFVPCKSCNKRSRESLIEEINARRSFEYPFYNLEQVKKYEKRAKESP